MNGKDWVIMNLLTEKSKINHENKKELKLIGKEYITYFALKK